MTDKFLSMITKFENWCLDLEPSWVGIIVFMTTLITILMFLTVFTIFLVAVTNGLALLLPIIPIIYAWYVAIFKQGKKK